MKQQLEEVRRHWIASAWQVTRLVPLAAVAFSVLAGCSGPSGPVEVRRIGVISGVEAGLHLPVVNVPDTVAPGAAFDVVIQTYEIASCSRRGETDVAMSATGVSITPYNYVAVDRDCPRMYQAITHTVELETTTIGLLRIDVHGRDADANQLLTVQRTVFVKNTEAAE